jgi:hypothetical protein
MILQPYAECFSKLIFEIIYIYVLQNYILRLCSTCRTVLAHSGNGYLTTGMNLKQYRYETTK